MQALFVEFFLVIASNEEENDPRLRLSFFREILDLTLFLGKRTKACQHDPDDLDSINCGKLVPWKADKGVPTRDDLDSINCGKVDITSATKILEASSKIGLASNAVEAVIMVSMQPCSPQLGHCLVSFSMAVLQHLAKAVDRSELDHMTAALKSLIWFRKFFADSFVGDVEICRRLQELRKRCSQSMQERETWLACLQCFGDADERRSISGRTIVQIKARLEAPSERQTNSMP
jgi:hypothetical protein